MKLSKQINDHGIKNQKWGIRRWQNKDGTLTEAGKQRLRSMKRKRLIKDLESLDMKKKNVMLGKTPAVQYNWKDKNGDPVAEFKVWDWWDGKNVSDLEINEKYRGLGLSYELLDYATKNLGVKNLAVNKTNTIAKHVYDKYGFEVTEEDDDLYYMSLKERKK